MSIRPIPGWPGYHVDEEGRVYSTRRRVDEEGRVYSTRRRGAPRELAQFDRRRFDLSPTPYRSVNLTRVVDGKRKSLNRYVHHLVALAFIGPRPDGQEVLHGERGSSCNHASNLRYGTPEENSAERRIPRGADWYRARGLCPPEFTSTTTPIVAPPELEHAFADLIG